MGCAALTKVRATWCAILGKATSKAGVGMEGEWSGVSRGCVGRRVLPALQQAPPRCPDPPPLQGPLSPPLLPSSLIPVLPLRELARVRVRSQRILREL
eukprot:2179104-Rhodomonas_salina.1